MSKKAQPKRPASYDKRVALVLQGGGGERGGKWRARNLFLTVVGNFYDWGRNRAFLRPLPSCWHWDCSVE